VISMSLRGDRMGGLVRYLFGPGRAEEHTNQRIVGASDPTWLGTAQRDGAILAQLISELDEPVIVHGDKTRAGYVYHLVVSVPVGDGQLSDECWQQTARRFADKLGFDEQVCWIAINHGTSTNGNDHIHVVANLIRADDGRVHKLAFDRMRQREACVELEEEFGLTATSPAGVVRVPRAPRWYLTSPVPPSGSATTASIARSPSNSRRIDSYGRPIRWASTFSRPRWAIPIATSCAPASAATSRATSLTVAAPARFAATRPSAAFEFRTYDRPVTSLAMPPIRLTELTECGGCAAKLGADALAEALLGLGVPPDGNTADRAAGLIAGLDPPDDAAVHLIAPGVAGGPSLRVRLTMALRDAIRSGQIAAGTVLPSSRASSLIRP